VFILHLAGSCLVTIGIPGPAVIVREDGTHCHGTDAAVAQRM
jgi:hypothetical protein